MAGGAPTYIGETGFSLQPSPTSFTEGQGWSTTLSYRGASNKLADFLQQIVVIGLTFGGITGLRISPDGPYTNADVTFAQSPYNPNPAGADPIARTWNLRANMVEQDVNNHPRILTGFTLGGVTYPGLYTYTQSEMIAWRKQLAFMLSGEESSSLDPSTIKAVIFGLLSRGENSFDVPQYVLKKTDTVFSKTQLVPIYENVSKIHNYHDLVVAEPTLPSAGLIDALNLALAKIHQKPINWLKMPPEVDNVTAGRYQISQEYLGLSNFNPYMYDTVSTFSVAAYNQEIFSL